MVVLYIGIIKVWGFLPKNPTYKPAKYLLCDRMAALFKVAPNSFHRCCVTYTLVLSFDYNHCG